MWDVWMKRVWKGAFFFFFLKKIFIFPIWLLKEKKTGTDGTQVLASASRKTLNTQMYFCGIFFLVGFMNIWFLDEFISLGPKTFSYFDACQKKPKNKKKRFLCIHIISKWKTNACARTKEQLEIQNVFMQHWRHRSCGDIKQGREKKQKTTQESFSSIFLPAEGCVSVLSSRETPFRRRSSVPDTFSPSFPEQECHYPLISPAALNPSALQLQSYPSVRPAYPAD